MRSVPLAQAIDEAERRGDPDEALRLMLTHPEGLSFWRPRRYTSVLQMSTLGAVVPSWAASRWVLGQAVQRFGERHDPVARRRFRRALELAVELRGGSASLPGHDVVDQQCRVMDHDWVYRELFLYDLGGLQHFVDRVATRDLLDRADQVAAWASSPMGGYRLLRRDPGTEVWEDLAGDVVPGTANIGSAVALEPGDCVIGRMVPIEAGVMFEAAPLPVPEAVAGRVALEPHGWVDALRAGPADLTVAGAQPCSGLLSDVPDGVLWRTLTGGRGRSAKTLREEMTVVRLVMDLGARLLAGGVDQVRSGSDPWSCLSGALLDPIAVQALARRHHSLAPVDREVLAALGDVLAEPAATWCRMLARAPAEAA
jgi:hypothetical protein